MGSVKALSSRWDGHDKHVGRVDKRTHCPMPLSLCHLYSLPQETPAPPYLHRPLFRFLTYFTFTKFFMEITWRHHSGGSPPSYLSNPTHRASGLRSQISSHQNTNIYRLKRWKVEAHSCVLGIESSGSSGPVAALVKYLSQKPSMGPVMRN